MQRRSGDRIAAWLAAASNAAGRTAPIIDLLIRAWLAQLFWMAGVTGVLDWHAALSQTPGLADAISMHPHQLAVVLTALRLVLPPFLLVGFATRLAALPILVLSVAAYRAGTGQDAPLLWALLGGWFVLLGPGPISLDSVIARGIYRSALPLAPAAGRLLTRLGRATRPAGLAMLRLGVAAVLIRHGMLDFDGGILLGALLAAGLATRLAALPLLAATATATMHAVSNEHVCWMLLVLLIMSHGPGALSVDAMLGAAWRRFRAASPAAPGTPVACAAAHRHRRRRFRRHRRRARPAERALRDNADRPAQLPSLPALAVSGRHRQPLPRGHRHAHPGLVPRPIQCPGRAGAGAGGRYRTAYGRHAGRQPLFL